MIPFNKEAVFVTGAPRSGASLVAKLLHASGVFGGDIQHPHSRGRHYWIMTSVVAPLLRTLEADPDGQSSFPVLTEVRSKRVYNLDLMLEALIRRDGYTQGPWFYKDYTLCLTHPIWRKAFPAARWVVVRRKDYKIIKSCMNTGYMTAYNTEEGWAGWVRRYEYIFEDMRATECNYFEFWPERILEFNDWQHFYDLLAYLRVPINSVLKTELMKLITKE